MRPRPIPTRELCTSIPRRNSPMLNWSKKIGLADLPDLNLNFPIPGFSTAIVITDASNNLGGTGLWDPTDGFYYDQLKLNGQMIPLRSRSLVGLLPLIAVEVLEEEKIQRLPGFWKRMKWFIENRPDLARLITWCETCPADHQRRMLAI